jgi:uncharacterized protein YkwD
MRLTDSFLLRTVGFATALASTMLLGACGGSTSNEAVSETNTNVAPTIAVATPNAPNSFVDSALEAINEARSMARQCGTTSYPAVPSLQWNSAVAEAARLESAWLQANNAFDHVWTDGTGPGERLSMAQYNWATYGENIAAGQTGIGEVVGAWLASPGHCANIMRAGVSDLGLAKVDGNNANSYSNYWTMLVARAK